jgi:hypothetical protein
MVKRTKKQVKRTKVANPTGEKVVEVLKRKALTTFADIYTLCIQSSSNLVCNYMQAKSRFPHLSVWWWAEDAIWQTAREGGETLNPRNLSDQEAMMLVELVYLLYLDAIKREE